MRFKIYCFDTDRHTMPQWQDYELPLEASDRMVLDALVRLKAQDDSIAWNSSTMCTSCTVAAPS